MPKLQYLLCIIILITSISLFAEDVITHKIGWIPLEPSRYTRYLHKPNYFDKRTPIPKKWNWKEYNAVTIPKDQGSCNACWSFAATAALESHLIITHSEKPSIDLSEQLLVSCFSSPNSFGCFGGTIDAIRKFEYNSPRLEECYPYRDGEYFNLHSDNTKAPFSDQVCYYQCDPLCYNIDGFYTIDVNNIHDIKQSIKLDGPCIIGFFIYSDFKDYWNNADSVGAWEDGVYKATTEQVIGGHSVMVYGWDDEASAFLCKNSWGASSGPSSDGCFKLHYNEVMAASNFKVIKGECAEYPINLMNPIFRLKTNDVMCHDYNATIMGVFQIQTKFLERVQGGIFYTALKTKSGEKYIIPEPIENKDFVQWDEQHKTITKNTCIMWNDNEILDIEMWIVDSEGVESEHVFKGFHRPKSIPHIRK